MKTVGREQFRVNSLTRYRIVEMRYPKYLDYHNAMAKIEIAHPTGVVETKHIMVSMYGPREGTIYLEDVLIKVVWDAEVIHHISLCHYA